MSVLGQVCHVLQLLHCNWCFPQTFLVDILYIIVSYNLCNCMWWRKSLHLWTTVHVFANQTQVWKNKIKSECVCDWTSNTSQSSIIGVSHDWLLNTFKLYVIISYQASKYATIYIYIATEFNVAKQNLGEVWLESMLVSSLLFWPCSVGPHKGFAVLMCFAWWLCKNMHWVSFMLALCQWQNN